MAKPSISSGKTSSVMASTVSPTSKDKSFVVSHPLTPSEIAWLKQQSKRVAVASSQRSTLAVSVGPTAGLASVAGKLLGSPKASRSAKRIASSVLTNSRRSVSA